MHSIHPAFGSQRGTQFLDMDTGSSPPIQVATGKQEMLLLSLDMDTGSSPPSGDWKIGNVAAQASALHLRKHTHP